MKTLFPDIRSELEWLGYLEMRKRIKKPMTDRAIQLALGKLEKLASGDILLQKKILDQSTFCCWAGLYPLTTDKYNMQENPKSEYICELEQMLNSPIIK